MNSLTDQQLLCDYTGHQSEAAFAELVRRHIDFVYSAALRMVRDTHLAEDVTQGTFVALAQNARQLADRPVLSGWLHRTAQNLAANTVRSDVRRRAREQEAAAMNELLAAEPDALWENIAPYLDDALGELSEPDRDALLLRYFERKSAREMAQTLGTSEDAAQKRVNRAVEHLREFLSKRGVTVGASGLVVVITASAVQAAPAGVAVTISTAAVLAGTVASTTVIAATKTIAMTTLQKTVITATLAVVAGSGIYEARQAAQLREQNQALQQQQAPLTGQLTKLQAENERLSNQVVQARDSQVLSKAQFNELLKLRGQVGMARADSRELARLKSTLAQQTSNLPDYLTNSMAMGMEFAKKLLMKDAQARLARMKKILNLTDDQVQAISDIMQKHIQSQTQMPMELMSGKLTPEQEQQATVRDTINQEAEIKALFTPEQLTAYPESQQAEKLAAADNAAKTAASRIADDFNLSQEQQEQIHASFYQMNLNEPARQDNFLNQEAISAAKRSGNSADAFNLGIELQKSQLEEKIKILGNFLTPEQINTYRAEQMNQINMGAQMMKAFYSQKPAGTTN